MRSLLSQIYARIYQYRWPLAGLGVAIAIALYFAAASLNRELEEKFHAVSDSVPTRVYSSVYWLKAGVGASSEELRFRFKERDYREVPVGEVKSPGSYALETDPEKRPTVLTVYTNEFDYPTAAKEVIFGSPDADTFPKKFTVLFEGGFVTKVLTSDNNETPAGFALPPTLVAQLNESGKEARRTVLLGEIPHTLIEGIVVTEDQRFLEHMGLDPRGIARSIWVNLRSGSYVQGASTITQQLARNVYLTRNRTISRKVKEMVMSIFLELRYSKDEILQKYLNEVYFGQSGSIAIHGVAEAARFYFNKNLDELTIAEQAFLAGIVKGPFYFSPYNHPERAKSRAAIVLGKMHEAGVITEPQYKSALTENLKFAKLNTVQNRAPYFTDMVQIQLLKDLPEQEALASGYKIFSTIDTYYQQLAENSVASGVGRLEAGIQKYVDIEAKAARKKKKDPKEPVKDPAEAEKSEERVHLVEGVFVAVDPSTGHLLSLVGGRSYAESNYNRALLMKRHIGSLIKPFVYLSALMYDQNPDGTPVNAISKFEDKPFTYEYDKKTWSPKNYEDEFEGTVTLRYALARSLNTVAAQVAVATGLDKLVDVSQKAGLANELEAFPSLSLGAVGVPPVDVARAYTTLANFGVRKELTAVLAISGDDGHTVAKYQPREDRVLPPEETANLVQILTSVFELGTAHPARTAGFNWPASGKTGTTNEFRDAWFAGFTRRIVGVSWIGFDRDSDVVRKHRKALKLTGAVAALPVWTDFMIRVHRGQNPMDLAYPDGALRKERVDLISGGRAGFHCMGESVVEEVFTYRNVPSHECN